MTKKYNFEILHMFIIYKSRMYVYVYTHMRVRASKSVLSTNIIISDAKIMKLVE